MNAMINRLTSKDVAIKAMQQYIDACRLTPVADPVSFKHAPAADSLAQCAGMAAEMARILKVSANNG